MGVTNQQMLEKWNEMPLDTRLGAIANFHKVVVEGALEKDNPIRQQLDMLRASGKDMSDWVLFLIHRDERQTMLKMDKTAKLGIDQVYWGRIQPRSRTSTGSIPKKYRSRFEYVKTHKPTSPTPGKMFVVTVISENAIVHEVDLDLDDKVIAAKAAEEARKAEAAAAAAAAEAAEAAEASAAADANAAAEAEVQS